jgi:hypothetical protein
MAADPNSRGAARERARGASSRRERIGAGKIKSWRLLQRYYRREESRSVGRVQCVGIVPASQAGLKLCDTGSRDLDVVFGFAATECRD